jgi:hypothetical protein
MRKLKLVISEQPSAGKAYAEMATVEISDAMIQDFATDVFSKLMASVAGLTGEVPVMPHNADEMSREPWVETP